MFLWFMFLSHVLGAPTDEFGEFTKNSEGGKSVNLNNLPNSPLHPNDF